MPIPKALQKSPPEVACAPPLVGQASVPAKVHASVPEKLRKDVVVPQMHKSVGFIFNIMD